MSKTSQSKILTLVDQIHSRAVAASQGFRNAEAELIEALQAVDQHRVYMQKGYSSLFQYTVNGLGLSESVTYNLITVSRKAREVPELKNAIQSGIITLSNARKIVPVLNELNQKEWLEKASTLSNRQLDKEVARVRPMEAVREVATYVSESRVQLKLGIAETEMIKLRRAQDLLSQARRKSVSLEELITVLTGEYLQRHDPVQKAKRHIVKNGMKNGSIEDQTIDQNKTADKTDDGKYALNIFSANAHKPVTLQVRTPIPVKILHMVNLRDGRKCTHLNPDGIRCNQARFIEIHHLTPVSSGGLNTVKNLITLCSTHHQYIHRAN